MKNLLLGYFFLFISVSQIFGQKVRVEKSPKAIVIVGHGNTVTTTTKKVNYYFSLTPKEQEIRGFLNKVNNSLGITFINPQYNLAYRYNNGKFIFVKDEKADKFIYLINLQNNVVIDLSYYDSVLPDSISNLHIIQSRKKFGFINELGKIVVRTQYDSVQPFKRSLFSIVKTQKFGIIGKNGNILFSPDSSISQIIPYSNTLAFIEDINGIKFVFDAQRKTLRDSSLYSILKQVNRYGITGVNQNDSIIQITTYLGEKFTYSKRNHTLSKANEFIQSLNYSPKLMYFAKEDDWYYTLGDCSITNKACYDRLFGYDTIFDNLILVYYKYTLNKSCTTDKHIRQFYKYGIYNPHTTKFYAAPYGPGHFGPNGQPVNDGGFFDFKLPEFKLESDSSYSFQYYEPNELSCWSVLDPKPISAYLKHGYAYKKE